MLGLGEVAVGHGVAGVTRVSGNGIERLQTARSANEKVGMFNEEAAIVLIGTRTVAIGQVAQRAIHRLLGRVLKKRQGFLGGLALRRMTPELTRASAKPQQGNLKSASMVGMRANRLQDVAHVGHQ